MKTQRLNKMNKKYKESIKGKLVTLGNGLRAPGGVLRISQNIGPVGD